jgi:hypothetical protein
MLLAGKRCSRGSGSSTVQEADTGREPFVRVGEAVLERARAVARTIAQRVRRLADDESPGVPDPPGEPAERREPDRRE